MNHVDGKGIVIVILGRLGLFFLLLFFGFGGVARSRNGVHVEVLAGTDEFSHPGFVVFVVVSLLLLWTGHAGLDDHQRDDDGEKVDHGNDPNHHVRRVAERGRNDLGFNGWFEGFFVRTNGGAVQTVSTVVNDELDVLRDFVAGGIRRSNAEPMDAGFKVTSRDVHVSGQRAVVVIEVGEARKVRPRC